MLKSLLEGLILGLSLGTSCLATCTPVYIPFLIAGRSSIGKSILKVTEISAGRFISYLAFGAVAGLIGVQIEEINRLLFTSSAYILLSVFLFFNALSQKKQSHNCAMSKRTSLVRNGFLLGLLTGINFCPSFLIAVAKAVNIGGVTDGIFLFGGFFIGTSLFLFPLAIFGVLSTVRNMRKISIVLSIIVSIVFFGRGVVGLKRGIKNIGTISISALNPAQKTKIISSEKNRRYFMSLRDFLSRKRGTEVEFATVNETAFNLPDPCVFFIADSDIVSDKRFAEFENAGHSLILDKNIPLPKLINYLEKHNFRVKKSEFLSEKFIEKTVE
ncbi:MAG: hypothetical protein CSB55_08350 [Candidatus Cloacimonadota bacterium]|nr:MAG: hypothetical protein CSB55_08350 [Candidatus Cloacimonadota bacterium]